MNIFEILREEYPDVSPNTIKLYARSLEVLRQKCDGDDEYKFLLKPKKVLECVSSNDNTRKLVMTAILQLLRVMDVDKDIKDVYRDEQMKSIEAVNEFYRTGKKSEKQEENWLSREDLEAILGYEEENYEKLRNKVKFELRPAQYLDAQNYILLLFHLKHPIRNDLHDVKIVTIRDWKKMKKDDQKTGNYLAINKNEGFLILNDYKTQKTYGRKTIPLDDELIDPIMDFLKWRARHGFESNYFIINKYRQPMTSNSITKSFNRLFRNYGKNISTGLIRHIILTEMFGKTNDEKERMAEMMGNSTKTIDDKYVKK